VSLFSLTQHVFSTEIIYANTQFYEGLPADKRKIIDDSVYDAVQWENVEMDKAVARILGELKAAGTKIVDVDIAERRKMGEIMNGAVKEDIVKLCGQEIYDEVMKAVVATRSK
jgi:TRAP-type C4-dicarboxylate transport system substrate-binding protein